MVKDYYAILGIPRTADKTSIKRAYRRLSKQVHPDKSGTREGRAQFLDAKEAYDTLTDDAGRKAYDRQLQFRDSGRQRRTIPVRKSSFAEPSFSGPGRPRAPVEDLNPGAACFAGKTNDCIRTRTAIDLSPAEARQGITLPLRLSLTIPCPACGENFFPVRFLCPVCGGQSRRQTDISFHLRIPPGVHHGQTLEIPLHRAGLPDRVLAVTIRIA